MTTNRKGILIQGRMSSSRLPGKMLMPLGDVPLVEYVYRRCRESEQADLVAVLTSVNDSDNALADHCHKAGIPVFRGPLEDVLGRYAQAADFLGLDVIGRVCGDSPFVDVAGLDQLFAAMDDNGADYMRTTDCLNGFVSEVFLRQALRRASWLHDIPEAREHVTTAFRQRPDMFACAEAPLCLAPEELRKVTLTIDHPEDMNLARGIVQAGLSGFGFRSKQVLGLLHTMQEDPHAP